MDLAAAVSALRQGNTAAGVKQLASIAGSDTYEDVKGTAHGHLGEHYAAGDRPDHAKALTHFTASLALYPREQHCLAAAKCCIALERWKEARDLLVRTTREFPAGDKRILSEARNLLPGVMKKLAN